MSGSDAEKAVIARLDALIRLFNEGNYAEGAKLYHPKAKSVYPDREMKVGQGGALSILNDMPSLGVAKLERTYQEVEKYSDDIYQIYNTWKCYKTGGELAGSLKGITIWKRVNGEWLLYVDVSNSP